MFCQLLRRSASIRVVLLLVPACISAAPVRAQAPGGRYLGSSVESVSRYKCNAPKGHFDVSSNTDFSFEEKGSKGGLAIPYRAIASVQYGIDTTAKGGFCYPWDSYVQYTGKRHYTLTIIVGRDGAQDQAMVFELDKAGVRPTLAALESRTGRTVEFTDAIACTAFKTADECGHGEPSELKGLTKVFIDASSSRDGIASEIAASQTGVTLVGDPGAAEVILRYRSAIVAQEMQSVFVNGGMPMEAGHGEIQVVRNGRARMVLFFEDVKTSRLEKRPEVNFARTFVETYRKANSSAK